MKAGRLAAVAALVLAPSFGLTQSNVIPPSQQQQRDRQRMTDAAQDAAKSAAFGATGNIVRGAAIVNHTIGQSGTVQMVGVGNKVSKNFDRLSNTIDLAQAYRDGGVEAAGTTAAQMGLDHAVTSAAEQQLVSRAVGRAIGAGVAGAVASAGAAVALEGGLIAGSYIREMRIGDKTVGGHVDDFYFAMTPDLVKEAVSGVKQIDWESEDYQNELELNIKRTARQRAFERVQRENAQQQALLSAGAGQPAEVPAGSGASGFNTLLQTLNQGLELHAQMKSASRSGAPSTAAPQACRPAATLDPKTGCHPGHDEQAHPGGCKC
jgi:hypothetical protein